MNFQEFKNKYQKKKVKQYSSINCRKPLLSICVQTYQHVNYIRECLDGILMQKTSFPLEILLGDDESTDGTREICMAYAENHPDKIRLFLHHRVNNIKINGNPTGRFNFLYNLYSARGQYIALCEGDDYWTDPLKLQKQVDFLEENEEYGICFHNVEQKNLFTSQSSIIPGNDEDIIFDLNDYILSNRTLTCSLMLLRQKLGKIPDWFTDLPFGDLGLILIVMMNSNKRGMVLKHTMGVYRIHEGGVHGALLKNDSLYIKAYERHLQFLHIVEKNLLKQNYESALVESYIRIHRKLLGLHKKSHNWLLTVKTECILYYYRFRLKWIRRKDVKNTCSKTKIGLMEHS